MRVIDIEKFKLECAKFDKQALRGLLFEFAFQRTLHELVLINCINSCEKTGKVIPKAETLADYAANIEGERAIINLLGRKEAGKVYGEFEGITSDVKMVDFIFAEDAISHYQKLVESE